jgi:hypothetical protein
MKKILIALSTAVLCLAATANATIVTARFTFDDGSPIAGKVVLFRVGTPNDLQVGTYILDAQGRVSNDIVLDPSAHYRAQLVAPDGTVLQEIWSLPIPTTSAAAIFQALPAGEIDIVLAKADASVKSAQFVPSTLPVRFVQGKAALGKNVNSESLPFSSANSAGNLIVVGVDWHDSQSFGSISDSAGNSYTEVGSELRVPGRFRLRLYYAKNVAGGANTVTVSLSGPDDVVELYIHEYSGANPTAPLDVQSGATGTASSASSTAVTSTANDLVFGYCVTGLANVGSGFTVRSNLDSNLTEDKITATAGPVSATATASSAWALQMAAFKP